jgi:hypothetical protein
MNMQTRLKQKHGKANSPKRFTAKQPTRKHETQKGQQIQIQKNSPIIPSLHYAHKNSPNFLTKSRKIEKRKETDDIIIFKITKEEQDFLQTTQKSS